MFLLNRRSFVLGAAAAAALTWLGAPAFAQSAPSAEELNTAGPLGDRVLGDPNAPVTIVEYASMSCPHCGEFHRTTFDALKEKYIDTGKVRFIFREFPLDAAAYGAAMLAHCAPADRYFDVVDVFFERQEDWLRTEKVYDAMFAIAQQFGFSKESFDACLSNQALFESLEAIKQQGVSFGVNATPTFFINGEKQSGALTIEQLDEAIEPLL